MSNSSAPVILLLGMGAFVLTRKKRKRKKFSAPDRVRHEDPAPTPTPARAQREEAPEGNLESEVPPEVDFIEEGSLEEEAPETAQSPEETVLALEDSKRKSRLGGLYQIRKGDSPLKLAREALYGTRTTIQDADKRDNVVALSILIDCSPWNQVNYGRSAKDLKPGHAAIARGASALAVSFEPIYADNRLRMMNGQAPSGASGNAYAYIWIPMINMDLLDTEGIVTTMDMDWPDTEDGRGHSMIDPPSPVLALNFDDIRNTRVGCKLPEGDFRRTIEAAS